ncbi:phosphoglucosamine mutase [Salinirubellus salinus]|uniref:Phosphoglucosamine mutase n=1 Tax=Salinirubellus salinus TaxID=1364945 RepID=A0A9E7R043_9EURY|nr:phosphoglucosamine mutase [Salinirubellus salinus]UWM53226.1 phosphoglucosamine mutase [Salinirubellus salinus]
MFGTSGIRGPVGETVTADLALSVGRALGVDADRVVVGRDPRESGELLGDALTAGLREQGTDVIDVGLAATPTVARAVAWEDADAGVSLTASHNPAEDNGIKLWQPSGQAFDGPMQDEMTERVQAADWELQPWDGLGTRERTSATERHVQTLVDRVDLDRPLSVVVDLGNGAGGVGPAALSRLGCEVETLNAQPDGSFPGRPSEPTPENCESLATLVREGDADLGIAHDGDADRMRAVAGDGTYLSGDVLLAVLAGAAVESGDRVAVPVDTSLAVEDYLAERGASVERTPVGDVYVAAAVAEGAAFGGEPSGSWIWGTETLCPDGPLAAVKLVELAAERPLADRAAAVPDYPIRRANVETDAKAAVMESVTSRVREDYDDVTTMDGVRIGTDDGWFLVRASGTQPMVRVTAEAREAERTDALFETARSLVEAAVEEN